MYLNRKLVCQKQELQWRLHLGNAHIQAVQILARSLHTMRKACEHVDFRLTVAGQTNHMESSLLFAKYVKPKGSMYLYSRYLGLKGVPI